MLPIYDTLDSWWMRKGESCQPAGWHILGTDNGNLLTINIISLPISHRRRSNHGARRLARQLARTSIYSKDACSASVTFLLARLFIYRSPLFGTLTHIFYTPTTRTPHILVHLA